MTNAILNQDINIPNIIDSYVSLIRSEIDGQKVGEYTEFSFPFLDRNNDYMSLYIKPIGEDLFEVTDGGHIIDNLEMSGIPLIGTRKALADNLAKTYGVNITNGALTIKSSQKSLANSKHKLLQLMMKIDDLFFLTRSNVISTFFDEVKDFLNAKNIFFTESISLNGETGFSYTFDMLFQRTNTQPPRFCSVRNELDPVKTQNLIFGWTDCEKVRADNSEYIIIYNKELSSKCKSALDAYNIGYIPYSDPDRLVAMFR